MLSFWLSLLEKEWFWGPSMPIVLPPLLSYVRRLPWVLRGCGRELTKLHLSDCCQGMKAYSSGTLGFQCKARCLKFPSFGSFRWPSPSGGWENSTFCHIGCWSLLPAQMPGMGRVPWLCVEGRKVSEEQGLEKPVASSYHLPQGGWQQHFSREMAEGWTDQVTLR